MGSHDDATWRQGEAGDAQEMPTVRIPSSGLFTDLYCCAFLRVHSLFHERILR